MDVEVVITWVLAFMSQIETFDNCMEKMKAYQIDIHRGLTIKSRIKRTWGPFRF